MSALCFRVVVGDHAHDGNYHAATLAQGDDLSQEQAAPQEHQDRLGVAHHLIRHR